MRFIPHRAAGPRKPIPSSFTTTSFPREGTSRPGNSRSSILKSFVRVSNHCGTKREYHSLLRNQQIELKGETHVHHLSSPNNYPDPRAVHRRAYRLRAGPFEAFWQQRRRVPQGASVGPHTG